MQNFFQSPSSTPPMHRQPPGPKSKNTAFNKKSNPRGGSFQLQPSPVSTYWTVFRLADALTQDLIEKIRAEVEASQLQPGMSEADRRRQMAQRIEAELFAGHGDCWLGDEEIVRMVQAAIQVDHGRRYTLRAWSILPNHMHIVFTVAVGVDPAGVIRDWKTFTERQANLATGRGNNPFWERSTYTRPCLDDAEVIRRIKSVEFRPVNAELCRRPSDWPWSSAGEPSAPVRDPAGASPHTATGLETPAKSIGQAAVTASAVTPSASISPGKAQSDRPGRTP
jgi:REP element-mobilizing transposase RayT